jgi:hypothetical protein
MPYPESCPECGSAFRNTGTHFTARRNEVGRHVLLELGCQNTTRRFWWDFTTGSLTEDGRTSPARRASLENTVGAVAVSNGSLQFESNGHSAMTTLEPPPPPHVGDAPIELIGDSRPSPDIGDARVVLKDLAPSSAELEMSDVVELPSPPPVVPSTLKDAFVRQLQLDRLTLRQMRSWLMSDEARRAIEVAAGATEATYERLALILFGVDLPQLLGKQAAVPPSTGMSAEERLELQREKARIRARLRRAAAKAARQT